MVSDKQIFSCFPCISLCKTCDPWGGTIFGPRGIISTELVEVYLIMLHTKYPGCRLCGFIREDFFMFSLCKVRTTAKIRERFNQVPHLTQDTTWESNKNTINITNKSQEVSPFPAGDHKAAMNRREGTRNTRYKKTKMIHKRSTALERSVKIFYWRA